MTGVLILEITESVMLDAEDRLQGDLATLEAMGCVLSVDDVGRAAPRRPTWPGCRSPS